MKTLVLRFDIDTCRCIEEGVPNLLELARQEGVRFAFFSNMGRAVSRTAVLKRLVNAVGKPGGRAGAAKLPSSVKLGLRQITRTIVLNPLVGVAHPDVLRQAHRDGHDIGLHGGANHGAWQHGFHNWDDERIRREVSAGKTMFERVLGHAPAIFSSPGWQGSDSLNAVLKSMGFKASADRHGPDESELVYNGGFWTLPTNLLAEPGGVGYFESFEARNYSEDEATEQFAKALDDDRNLYALYDHPCFAGAKALNLVRRVIHCARDRGVQVTTYSALIRQQVVD